jgi:hypothetical protein
MVMFMADLVGSNYPSIYLSIMTHDCNGDLMGLTGDRSWRLFMLI